MPEELDSLSLNIKGLEWILPPDGAIKYYSDTNGLSIVINGDPGTGKSLLAMQIAMNAAFQDKRQVIYLTKDSDPESLLRRIVDEFDLFSLGEIGENQKIDTIVESKLGKLGEKIEPVQKKELFQGVTNYIDYFNAALNTINPEAPDSVSNIPNSKNPITQILTRLRTLKEKIDDAGKKEVLDRLSTIQESLAQFYKIMRDHHSGSGLLPDNINENSAIDFFNALDRNFVFLSRTFDEKGQNIEDSQHWVHFQILEQILDWLKDTKFDEEKIWQDIVLCKALNPVMKHSLVLLGKLNTDLSQDFSTNTDQYNPFEILKGICPSLSQVFNWISKNYDRKWIPPKERNDQNVVTRIDDVIKGVSKEWSENLLIVFDSQSPEIIEHYLKWKSYLDKKRQGKFERMPIWVFVSEDDRSQNNRETTYLPDIHIRLSIENASNKKTCRHIQFNKSRYQHNLTDPFPFSMTSKQRDLDFSVNDISKSNTHQTSIDCSYHGIWIHPNVESYFNNEKRTIIDYKMFCEKRLKYYHAIFDSESTSMILDVFGRVSEKDYKNRKAVFTNDKFHDFDKIIQNLYFSIDDQLKIKPNINSSVLKGLLEKVRTDIPKDEKSYWPDLKMKWIECLEKSLFLLDEISKIEANTSKKTDHNNSVINFGKEVDEKLYRVNKMQQGGCHLVLSENRCHSTTLGLYYLLYDNVPPQPKENQYDTLYISLDENLLTATYNIQRSKDIYTLFKTDLFSSKSNMPTEQAHDSLFYRFPYKSQQNEQKALYIWPISPLWCPGGKVLEALEWILAKTANRAIKRVLFNRVSRIETCLPTTNEVIPFISSIIKICKSSGVDLFLIDDTADQSSSTGHVNSHWLNLSDDVIRLKRVSVEGTQSVAMEVLKHTGWGPRYHRALELCYEHAQGEVVIENIHRHLHSLSLKDTFRGYKDIFTENPAITKIKVHLPFDRDESDLKNELNQVGKNLQVFFGADKIDIQAFGPNDRPGVNSTYAGFANLTHDMCHIMALDEIWLSSFLQTEKTSYEQDVGLIEFGKEDLERALPYSVKENIKNKNRENITYDASQLGTEYVTQALSLEYAKRSFENKKIHAIPFYHNWGVFVITVPYKRVLKMIFEEFPQTKTTAPTPKTLSELFKIQKPEDDPAKILDWFESPTSENAVPTWTEIRDFKLNHWDKVIDSKVMLNLVNQIESTPDGELRKIFFKKGFHFEFFTFNSGTAEACISFLLEILLSHNKITDIFSIGEVADPTKAYLLSIKTEDTVVEKWTDSLILIFQLLSSRQRRKVAYGDMSSFDGLSLFSREWLTSITPLRSTGEPRQQIILKHLPTFNKPDENFLYKNIDFINNGENVLLSVECKGKGTPVSGSWYLGALKGGNSELAADVIMELVSDERERERMIKRQGAPVAVHNYCELDVLPNAKPTDEQLTEFSGLPYSKLLRLIQEQSKTTKLGYIFPFSRVRIKNYSVVGLELYELIKNAMRVQCELNKDKDELKGKIMPIVQNSLAKIQTVINQFEKLVVKDKQ